MSSALRACGVVAAAVCSSTLLAAPASAGPPDPTFPVVCDDGKTYDIVTARGNGLFTPAFSTAGRFIPVSFGEFVFTVHGVDTEQIDFPITPFVDPPVVKGAVAGKTPHALLTCTYGFSVTLADEPMLAVDFPGATHGEGTGTVTGFLVPPRR